MVSDTEPQIECPHRKVSVNNPPIKTLPLSLSVSRPTNINLSYPTDELSTQIRSSFMRSTKYIVKSWFPYCYGGQTGPIKPNGIDQRTTSTATYVLAVALKTNAYDEEFIGVSKKSALLRTKRLLLGVAAKHIIHNGNKGDTWGHDWQSSYWAFYLGTAGWLLYDDLNISEREVIAKVVESEANFQLSKKDALVSYYANTSGLINIPGDTKAEENAWNSTVFSIANVMMPNHRNSYSWKMAEAKLHIGSYARPSDTRLTQSVSGDKIKNWVNGWNVYEDGTLVNHNILSPEYMANIGLKLNSIQLSNLANQAGSMSALWSSDVIYNSFVNKKYSSPPYKKPGGSVYTKDTYKIYFPEGNDWGTQRISNYIVMDTAAKYLGFGRRLNADKWTKLHLQRQLSLQDRFSDGRTYDGTSDGKESEYSFNGREQVTAGDLAQTWLWVYLEHNHLLSVENNPLVLSIINAPIYPKIRFF